ncbi:hypothetical protein IAT40_007255 [Kwoniella sp. CBS 6097]
MDQIDVLCPADLTACKVLGGDDLSFECIDVTSELESCGGCLHGDFGADAVQSPRQEGLDCLALPGVASASGTCDGGKCKVFACDEGYKLTDHRCISMDI